MNETLSRKIARRLGRWSYFSRRRLGLLPRRRGLPGARLGIYVAYYDSSRFYSTHLDCIARNTVHAYNYYVMKNCSTAAESEAFEATAAAYGLGHAFRPWPRLDPLPHGESLQRMIDMTDDDVIVLCDVDAFPIRRGWDEFVLSELETKDVVAVVAHFPHRSRLPVFLHPSFMAFRRDYMVRNALDVFPGAGTDPAYRFTQHMMAANEFDERHVTGLFPSHREVTIPNSLPDARVFGRTDLLHGFGTTYSDLVFHFWHSSNIRNLTPIYNDDGQLVVTPERISAIVDAVNARFASREPRRR